LLVRVRRRMSRRGERAWGYLDDGRYYDYWDDEEDDEEE
jgi:hypothetical protein